MRTRPPGRSSALGSGPTNGNRIADCDLLDFAANGSAASRRSVNESVRFGRDPNRLTSPASRWGSATVQCGRRGQGIPAAVQAYCNAYGDTLLDGWGTRRYEWQFSLGVQHELLPRLSAEVTYNRRKYGNLPVPDMLGMGCDRFNGAGRRTAVSRMDTAWASPARSTTSSADRAGGPPTAERGKIHRFAATQTRSRARSRTTGTAQTLMQGLRLPRGTGINTNFVVARASAACG